MFAIPPEGISVPKICSRTLPRNRGLRVQNSPNPSFLGRRQHGFQAEGAAAGRSTPWAVPRDAASFCPGTHRDDLSPGPKGAKSLQRVVEARRKLIVANIYRILGPKPSSLAS